MVVTMFLAHLVGDYVLQWDSLARWKSRELKGVLVHGLIVGAVAWLFSLPFDRGWWPWVLVIWLTHVVVDAIPLALSKRISFNGLGTAALVRFLTDQGIHVAVILTVLVCSGFLAVPSLTSDLLAALRNNRWLAITLGYAFITMPAWILVEFLVYGLVNGSAPDFSQSVSENLIRFSLSGKLAAHGRTKREKTIFNRSIRRRVPKNRTASSKAQDQTGQKTCVSSSGNPERDFLRATHRLCVASVGTRSAPLENRLSLLPPVAKRWNLGAPQCCFANRIASR
jgi:hypothetical protein